MEIVFWHNIVSPHQAPLMRALAQLGNDVTVVAAEPMTRERVALGWGVSELGPAKVILNPSAEHADRIVDQSGIESVHVMAGVRWSLLGDRAAKRCCVRKRRMGIISEAPDTRGMKGWARWLKYVNEFMFRGSHYDFILGMGKQGVDWFGRCGYPESKRFPFCYVVDAASGVQARQAKPGPGFCILFVGQFISRKGIDLLVDAFRRIRDPEAVLVLVGDGVEKAALLRTIEKAGISRRVKALPPVANAEARVMMAACDLCVLPSRYDGWGAVVNESFLAGTPVICSDRCGASDLIQHPWLGSVFPAGDVIALANILNQWMDMGSIKPDQRNRILAWSECISAQQVARYFLDVIANVYDNAPRPIAPWRQTTEL